VLAQQSTDDKITVYIDDIKKYVIDSKPRRLPKEIHLKNQEYFDEQLIKIMNESTYDSEKAESEYAFYDHIYADKNYTGPKLMLFRKVAKSFINENHAYDFEDTIHEWLPCLDKIIQNEFDETHRYCYDNLYKDVDVWGDKTHFTSFKEFDNSPVGRASTLYYNTRALLRRAQQLCLKDSINDTKIIAEAFDKVRAAHAELKKQLFELIPDLRDI
jgi:hypothetical protein